MSYRIEKIEYSLPTKVIDNKHLERECGISPDFLEKKIGIKERRVLGDGESVLTMAYEAARKITASLPESEHVELLIICTQNPDYRLPTTACLLQDRLKLRRSCMAFDINLGCSGFVYSLAVVGGLIDSKLVSNGLIVVADAYSRLIDYRDKNTASLFGDAAAAIYVKGCEAGYGAIDSVFGTDGSGAFHLVAHNSGVVKDSDKSDRLYMNGREIFKFSIDVIPDSVNSLLQKNGLAIGDIKYFIFHQANKYMLEEIQKKLRITPEQMIIDMELCGNTVSATIPIALKNLMDRRKTEIKKGDLMIFCGFGVGLSWGTVLYKHI